MNLVEMVKLQDATFDSKDTGNVDYLVSQLESDNQVANNIATLELAIAVQTKIVNATYNYELDRIAVGGPTALYQFVKDVRNALRTERNTLLGKSSNQRATQLREKFATLQSR